MNVSRMSAKEKIMELIKRLDMNNIQIKRKVNLQRLLK